MLAVFEDQVFLFFDRESRRFDAVEKDVHLTWDRWKREAIDKQISTAAGAKNYVRRYRDHIFLGAKGTIPFPLTIPAGELHIHKIIVAHGAKEACLRFSKSNVSGSLGIAYGSAGHDLPLPFLVSLDKEDPVHLLDSHNLAIVLAELDTIHDLNAYLDAKEAAIRDLDFLAYCGEEDLLGHYFSNYNPATRAYFIGVPDGKYNGLFIGEGEWRSFVGTPRYRRRKRDNAISYLWDDLIQRTSQNALMGALIGNGNIFEGRSAIHEMAKEPRVSRRALSELIKRAIENFPADRSGIVRQVTRLPSFYEDKAYVFLQLWHPNITDYDGKYRPVRQHLLEVACGTAKNKFPALKQIIEIAIDAPKMTRVNSEDFILMNCSDWSEEQRAHYEGVNRELSLLRNGCSQSGPQPRAGFPHRGRCNSLIEDWPKRTVPVRLQQKVQALSRPRTRIRVSCSGA